jgi:uncharacterized protein YkwD
VTDHLLGGRSGRPAVVCGFAILAILGALALGTWPESASASGRCPNADVESSALSLHQLRRSISCLVQHKREDHGLHRFEPNRRLRSSAKRHNTYMLAIDCFSHQCSGEPDLLSRVRATGYIGAALSYTVGEDLGYSLTPGRMIRSWMHDTLHRRNILSGDFEDFGVSAARDCPHDPTYAPCSGVHDATYTINFGRRGS